MVTFVDDATHYVADKDQEKVTEKISEKYKLIEKYMNENKLVINGDKSHLVVMSKKGQSNDAAKVILQAGNHQIKPSDNEKLLGSYIDGTANWKIMLRDGKDSVVKQITTRLNGLKKIAVNASFKTRLMVATGIIQSKLQYLMPLWIGAPDYLINALQVQQLNAARCVCGYKSYFWSTSKLLETCGWLSIKQQMVASTVSMAHKIVTTGVPKNIKATLILEYPYRTRQATNGDIRLLDNILKNEKTFKFQARKYYNQIPIEIRQLQNDKFKKEMKKWVRESIPIR